MTKNSFNDFLYALRSFESGVDYARHQQGIIADWQIQSWVGKDNWAAYKDGKLTWEQLQYKSENSLGFVGYQFGEALLIDLGYYKDDVYYMNGASKNTWDGEFTGKNGINSLADLKTELQEHVIRDAFGFNLNVIESGLKGSGQSLSDFIGKTFTYKDTNGQTIDVELSLTGILAASHLRGAWGTLNLLKGGNASADENGTSILTYVKKFGGYEAPAISELLNNYLADADHVSPSGETTGLTMGWSWGLHEVKSDFDVKSDVVNLKGMFSENDLNIVERDGSVVIEVKFSGTVQQSYTLKGVSLSDLSAKNFVNAKGSKEFIEEALKDGTTQAEAPAPADNTVKPEAPTNQEAPKPEAPKPEAPKPEVPAEEVVTKPEVPVQEQQEQKVEAETTTDNTVAPSKPASTAEATVHEIKWSWGSKDIIEGFNTAKDVLEFKWMQPSSVTLSTNEAGDVVISIPSNSQNYTLKAIAPKDLSMDNFKGFSEAMIKEFKEFISQENDNAATETASTTNTDANAQAATEGEETAATNTPTTPEPTITEPTTPEPVVTKPVTPEVETVEEAAKPAEPVVEASSDTAEQGTIHTIAWHWGDNAVLDFDVKTDTLDFGWMNANSFELSDTEQGVKVEIMGNNQTYLLENVEIDDLSADNFDADDLSAIAEIESFIA